jgi:predicted CXXCH cytochrome family protein
MSASRVLSRLGSLALAISAVAWLGACTDIVYRDRPPFNPPPDAANGFLGYFTASTSQTTCGNCHVDHQGSWMKHKHSTAWADLQASGHAASYCSGCHAVSQNGNAVTAAAGINAVNDPAYYDVQCESCHGPGLTHVTTPDANTSPLARADADTLGDPASPNPKGAGTCAECHTGIHEPFVDQWRASRHGRANSHAYNNTSCQPCHEGRGVLRAWGVNSNYLEKNDAVTDTVVAMGITCAVCHDPHGNDNQGELRFPIDVPTLEGNLCMKCHSRRFEPTTTNSGPHGPQGAVLLGTAGWWPAGTDTTPQATTHGNPTANPKLCAGCHVHAFAVNDTAGNLTLQSVGHLFRPIPCIDQVTGVPLPGSSNSCAYNTTERNWSSCVASGCHADANAASQALAASAAVLQTLVDQLWVDGNGDQKVDTLPIDGGYLAMTPKADINNTDGVISVKEGAWYNAQLFGRNLTSHPDNSFGAHNPFLAQRILAATIVAMKAQYPFLPAPPPATQALMDQGVARAKALGRAVPLSTH